MFNNNDLVYMTNNAINVRLPDELINNTNINISYSEDIEDIEDSEDIEDIEDSENSDTNYNEDYYSED
jgi:hypothetical protein